MSYDIVFVGGGAATTSGFNGFLQDRISRDIRTPIKVAIIEPHELIGLGTAWIERDLRMSTNMTKSTLAVYGTYNMETEGFDVHTLTPLFEDSVNSARATKSYVTRETVGERLDQYWQITHAVAKRLGVEIVHIKQRAHAVDKTEDGYRIRIKNHPTIKTKIVVASLGLLSVNRFPDLAGTPGYFGESWSPDEVLDAISPSHRVAVLGIGPTGIDWLIRLDGIGFEHAVIAASRSGEPPAVRPRVDPSVKMDPFTPASIAAKGRKAPLEPRDIELLIEGVFAQAQAKQADFENLRRRPGESVWDRFERSIRESGRQQPAFDALKMLDSMAPTIWKYASDDGRRIIREKWAPFHRLLSFAIPPHNAEYLADFVNGGKVDLKAGLVAPPIYQDGVYVLTFANGEQVEVDVIINATGSEGPIEQVNNQLVQQMLASKLIVPDRKYDGALMCAHTGQVMREDGSLQPGLFIAGGSLTKGATYMVNTLIGTSEQGLNVGRAVSRELLNLEAIAQRRRVASPQAQLPFIPAPKKKDRSGT